MMHSLVPPNHDSTEESITSQVYSHIRDGDFSEAIQLLDATLYRVSRSRPVLSLLAFCCYNNREYTRAAEFYEELVALCPDEDEYRVYYMQSLVMSGGHPDACRVAAAALSRPNSDELLHHRLRLLHARSQMELGLLSASSKTLSKCIKDDPATVVAMAAVDYAAGKFSGALDKYKIAKQMLGDTPMLLYYMALCRYRMGESEEQVLDDVNDLLELVGVRDELDELNADELKEPFVIEVLNLKAVILSEMNQTDAARDTLKTLQNVDAISTHNEIMSSSIDADPTTAMQRLEQLLADPSFPPQTLANLLLLCIRHGEDKLVLETFESNKLVAKELLPPDLFLFIEAAVLSCLSPSDAFTMLEKIIAETIPKLKAAKKRLDETATASMTPEDRPTTTSIRPNTTALILATSIQEAKQDFDVLVQAFIPILMLQAKLFWERREYSKAEQLLLDHAQYCESSNAWNMNLAHILFAQQDDKLQQSIPYYERVVNECADNKELIKTPAVALANLCAAYIMNGQMESAEAIIKAVGSEEHKLNAELENDFLPPTHHACLVNLVIGTLYCEQGNYEFGISRIIKSLEPLEKNLCADIWFYCKRCLLAMASKMSKLMIVVNREVLCDVIEFLRDVEFHGKNVEADGSSQATPSLEDDGFCSESATISQEARQLKHLFLKLSCDHIS